MKKVLLLISIVFIFSCGNSNENKESDGELKIDNEISELTRKADSLYIENNYEIAVNYFSKILLKDTINAAVYFKRAFSYAQIFKYNESIKDYLKAVELDYRKNDAFFNLGCNYSSLGCFNKALLYFQKASEIEPNNLEIEIHIRICLKNLNKQEA